ncbi:uncharacterized protein LOC117239215 isoform X1 [Bombus vosnesenskii]|uniref:Uncharacterized protein LOC117239215 isoform X1 n=2 Tax=Bombus vosnesenskii TaxID=207650 RepID=A0A6J3L4I2_9HYME|nr:uncharacterized protein LOC117159324 isoform X1 [Bombus vancouverensis nearcticus]XP_033360538.1 uncharacterized protein LOC117239215 isoform X1 [Bombus vosnesenskii]XP_050487429.1 uncharacterized protein LOC126872012 isoform X1 [Bombus huntii]
MRKKIEQDTKNTEKQTDFTDVESKLRTLLKDGASTFMDFEWLQPELPWFFDEEKFRLGQQMFYNNAFTMMIAKLCGLLSLFAVPSIKDVLIFTRRSGTPCAAFRRYVSTILHNWVWYGKRAGIEKEFLESLKIVRKKHCVAFRRSSEAGLNRVSQLDMALAQFGFMGFTLLAGDYLGVNNSSEELEGLIHFWRVIGNMLGMEDKYNLCTGSVEETRALCRRLLDEVFLPSLASGSKDFEEMSRILIESLWPVNPYMDSSAFIEFTFILASTAATNNNHSLKIDSSRMSWYGRFILNVQLITHKYLLPTTYWWSRFFRAFFNSQMRLAIYLTENLPFLAFWSYGIKHSYVNIYKYRVI